MVQSFIAVPLQLWFLRTWLWWDRQTGRIGTRNAAQQGFQIWKWDPAWSKDNRRGERWHSLYYRKEFCGKQWANSRGVAFFQFSEHTSLYRKCSNNFDPDLISRFKGGTTLPQALSHTCLRDLRQGQESSGTWEFAAATSPNELNGFSIWQMIMFPVDDECEWTLSEK